MKESKELKEIHGIMEKIYEEEKRLNAKQRVRKLREESEKFMLERTLCAAPSGLRITIRCLSGASRRPSSG